MRPHKLPASPARMTKAQLRKLPVRVTLPSADWFMIVARLHGMPLSPFGIRAFRRARTALCDQIETIERWARRAQKARRAKGVHHGNDHD
jgi:hypothetical protein